MCRAGGAVAVAGGDRGVSSLADGCAAGVHALLPQEAPLSGQRAGGSEGAPLVEGQTLRHAGRALCNPGMRSRSMWFKRLRGFSDHWV